MGFIPDTLLDLPLNEIATTADKISFCIASPATFVAVSGYCRASATLTTGLTGGDYTIGNGDSSGRKITLASKLITPHSNGTITHLVFTHTSGATIKCITNCGFRVTSGVPATLFELDIIELRDPT